MKKEATSTSLQQIRYYDPTLDAWWNEVIFPLSPDLFVLHAFNCELSLGSAQDVIRRWHDRCDLKIFGPGYCELRGLRTEGVVVFEHVLTNLHAHTALRCATHSKKTKQQILSIYQKEWKKLVPTGMMDAVEADPKSRCRMLDYMKKEWKRPGFFDDILVL